jgi:glycerophosphoryl diester phosphodiesterase
MSRRPPARFAFLDHPGPLAFAHRGGGLEAEENSIEAFESAVALGYTHLETDVQASRDGVAVVFHDDTLARMTGHPGRVSDYAWPAMSRISSRAGGRLTRLDDLLAAFPDAFFNIDAKTEASVAPLAEAIRRTNAVDRVLVASFEAGRVQRLRAALGDALCWSPAHAGVARIWLAGKGLPAGRIAFPAVQVPVRYGGIEIVTPAFLRVAHARGVQVHVWTVDEAAEMNRLLDLGVDGLMTDRPALLKRVLQARGQWRSATD